MSRSTERLRGNAIPVPQGTTISLQFNPVTGSSSSSFGAYVSTTITDSKGDFSISGLPAWDYYFSGSTLSARFVLASTSSIEPTTNSNWVVGTTDTVHIYAYPAQTTNIGTPLYFNIQTLQNLALETSNVRNAQDAEIDNFVATNPITLTFNNALVSYKPASTYLQRASDSSLVDAVPSIAGSVLTITPSSSLNANTRYIVSYSVTDGNTIATGSLPFETVGSGATAPTDLVLDATAKASATLGVSGYNAGDSPIYVQYTQNTAFNYSAQYKLSTESSWQTAPLTVTGVSGSIALRRCRFRTRIGYPEPCWIFDLRQPDK